MHIDAHDDVFPICRSGSLPTLVEQLAPLILLDVQMRTLLVGKMVELEVLSLI